VLCKFKAKSTLLDLTMEDFQELHHQGLRLSLGAFRTSPVESLHVEANEPSLENRDIKLGMQYATQSNFDRINNL
jgi:hypothetical protein